jgi:phasin family protein
MKRKPTAPVRSPAATATPDVATATPVVVTASPDDATPTPVVATATPDVATPTPVVATATPVVATVTPDVATATPDVATATPDVATATPVLVTTTPVVAAPAPVAPAKAVEMPAAAPLSSTLTQGIKTMMNTKFDFVAFGKDNLEAITAASKIWTAGVQDLTKQMASTAKASMEESMATFKALSGVKSVKEAIELQSTYSKAATAKALAESTKLSEASIKLTEQALAPITARMAVAVGSFSTAA